MATSGEGSAEMGIIKDMVGKPTPGSPEHVLVSRWQRPEKSSRPLHRSVLDASNIKNEESRFIKHATSPRIGEGQSVWQKLNKGATVEDMVHLAGAIKAAEAKIPENYSTKPPAEIPKAVAPKPPAPVGK
jgi:hypothetical protein